MRFETKMKLWWIVVTLAETLALCIGVVVALGVAVCAGILTFLTGFFIFDHFGFGGLLSAILGCILGLVVSGAKLTH